MSFMSIGAPEEFLDIYRGQENVARELLEEIGPPREGHLTMNDGHPVVDGVVRSDITAPSVGESLA